MTLQSLRANLVQQIQSGAVTLTDDVLGVPFLDSLFRSTAVSIRDAHLEAVGDAPAADSLTVAGVVDVLDVRDVGLSLTFSELEGTGLEIELEATLPAP